MFECNELVYTFTYRKISCEIEIFQSPCNNLETGIMVSTMHCVQKLMFCTYVAFYAFEFCFFIADRNSGTKNSRQFQSDIASVWQWAAELEQSSEIVIWWTEHTMSSTQLFDEQLGHFHLQWCTQMGPMLIISQPLWLRMCLNVLRTCFCL